MQTYLTAFSIAIVFSLILTRLVRDWATGNGWVDQPDSLRKLHARPMPRMGGIAIYLSLVLSLAAVFLLPSPVAAHLRESLKEAGILLALAGLMLCIGFWDDVKNLSPWTKFSAQILVAAISWTLGYRILGAWNGSGTVFYMGILSLPITIIWIVGIANAFNLIDGIDGLSSGAALLAMLSLIVVSILNNQVLSPLILAALAGATLGFLKYNFSPASIFLGDSGSLLLGFLLALMAVKHSEKSTTAIAIAVPIVAFGLPMLDMAIVMIRRFLSGQPIFLGDRRHIHHVLIELGLKPRHVVIILYGICGLFGLFSLLFMNPSGRTVGFALAILGTCVWFGIQQLHYPELRELNGYIARGIHNQRKLITGNVNVGRMLDGLRSARQLTDVLNCTSRLLEEMDFSGAEVRLPGLNENRLVLRAKNWRTVCEGRTHCLYRWPSMPTGTANEGLETVRSLDPDWKLPGKNFRLEFVFEVAAGQVKTGAAAGNSTVSEPSGNIGRLTFYHPIKSEFSVSAICLLSRDVWREFDKAVNRIMAQPNAGQSELWNQPELDAAAGEAYPSAISSVSFRPLRGTPGTGQ